MSQAQLPNELATFLENWTTDPNNAKDAFVRFKDGTSLHASSYRESTF